MMQPEIKIPPIIEPAPPLTYATPTDYTAPPTWTNVQIIHLSLEKRPAFLIALSIVHTLSALVMATVMAFAAQWIFPDEFSISARILIGIFTCLASSAVGLCIVVREYFAWSTYRLILADQGFIRFHSRCSIVRAVAADITRIVEQWDAFRIFFHNGTTALISKRIDNVDVLRDRLARWQPIRPGKKLLGIATTLALDVFLSLAACIAFTFGFTTLDRESMIFAEVVGTAGVGAIVFRVFRKKGAIRFDKLVTFVYALVPFLLALRIALWLQHSEW